MILEKKMNIFIILDEHNTPFQECLGTTEYDAKKSFVDYWFSQRFKKITSHDVNTIWKLAEQNGFTIKEYTLKDTKK